jgi:methyl-accepting chemotaxis protein
MSAEVIDGLNKTKASLPEKATEMNKLSDTLSTAFSACKPSIEAAAKTTDQAELTKIGERLRTECSTVLQAAIEQTAKATGEIGQQVSGIQAATQDSVSAIKDISGTIERLSEISSAIAAAVEEQGAATQKISHNVQQAAHGTREVSSHITDVQRGASETGSASSQVLSAAQSLSADSNRLKLEVDRFLDTVRAV